MLKRICIIDDDNDDRAFLKEALEEINPGVICEMARNGKEALQLLQNESSELPELIFLDMNMPVMGGKEFLTRIKKMEQCKNIPVVIYTTSGYEKDRYQTDALGAVDFISKPSRFPELIKQLKALLAKVMV